MKNKKQNSIEAPWPEKIPKEAKKILYCMRKIYHFSQTLTLDISKLQEWATLLVPNQAKGWGDREDFAML